jgi:broad specificity phosphatase PhoE
MNITHANGDTKKTHETTCTQKKRFFKLVGVTCGFHISPLFDSYKSNKNIRLMVCVKMCHLMTTILFVRHGESDANAYIHADPNDPNLQHKLDMMGDPDLTPVGHEQAKAVGEYLANKLFGQKAYVLTSQLARTKQTAEPFCKLHDTTYDSDELLLEYTRPHKLLTEAELKRGIKTHETWDIFTQQMETFIDALEVIMQCSGDKPIVIFGHSLFLSVMVSYLGSCKKMIPDKSQLTFRFPNCSITAFQYSQGTWKIFQVASIAHLPKEIVTGTECPYGIIN